MNTAAVFRRVMWKEYRVLRAFSIAVVLIVFATQAISWTYVPSASVQDAFIGIMSVAVGLYALGAASIMFAVEREEGTDKFLQALPVQSRHLFTAKFLVSFTSTIAVAVVLLLSIYACRAAGILIPPPADQYSWSKRLPDGVSGFAAAALLVYACGLTCSLLTRRPLVAACLGTGLAFVLTIPATAAQGIAEYYDFAKSAEESVALWNYVLLATAAVVLPVDVALGRRWLTGLQPGVAARKRTTLANPAIETWLGRSVKRRAMLAEFGRLLWQDVRQSWRMMAAFLGVPTLVCVYVARMPDGAEPRTQMAGLVALATMAIIGAAAFLPDQERSQFRFFAERPVRPRMVWLSRHMVWLPLALLYLQFGSVLWCLKIFRNPVPLIGRFGNDTTPFGYVLPIEFDAGMFSMPRVCVVAIAALLAYCCGQFCSMLFRSGIVAGFLALVLTAAIMAWSALMGRLNVSWLLSVLPIAISLLWITWLRAPHWITEKADRRAWTRLGLSIAAPAVAIVLATMAYRVWQIPAVDPGFSVSEYLSQFTPAGRETADMYLRAEQLVIASFNQLGDKVSIERADLHAARVAGVIPRFGAIPTEGEAREEWLAQHAVPNDRYALPWLAANQEALHLALAAAARPTCVFPPSTMHGNLWGCEKLIGTEAHRLGLAGDLEGMFKCEMALLRMSVHLRNHQFDSAGYEVEQNTLEMLTYWWATRPGQTPDTLRRAIFALEAWEREIPPPTDAVKAEYVWTRQLLDFDPAAISAVAANDRSEVDLTSFERLAKIMPWELIRARRAVDHMTNGNMTSAETISQLIKESRPTSRIAKWSYSPRDWGIAETTPLLRLFPFYYWNRTQYAWVDGALNRNSARLLLALQAWRLEHGCLPDSLHDLVGTYLERVPRDPFSGEEFRYFPQGVPELREVFLSTHRTTTPPFIWCCGPRLMPVVTNLAEQEYVEIDWAGNQSTATGTFGNMMRFGKFIDLPAATLNEDAELHANESSDTTKSNATAPDTNAPESAPPTDGPQPEQEKASSEANSPPESPTNNDPVEPLL